jgi:selenocysteine lyase/cysteine desulfurase
VDLPSLSEELSRPDRTVAAVVLTHAPTNGGIVNDAVAVGELIASLPNPPLYLLDACQTVGQVPLDVQELRCDVLAGTSRKWLRGPRGVGFMYVSPTAHEKGLLPPAAPDLAGATWQPGLESYELTAEGARQYEYVRERCEAKRAVRSEASAV